MTKRYRAAIIGTGKSVGNHLTALRSVGARVELIAAVDIDEARVRAFCDTHHISKAYTDAAVMLAAEHPDLVHIVTPPATHLQLVVQCLEAGAWVFCEKPLVLSLAEYDRLEAAEKRTGRYASTVFQWRFGSAAKHVKQLVERGELGQPLVGICNTLWYRGIDYYQQLPWHGKWAGSAGGVTTLMGIHLMDLFLWLVGEWHELYGMAAALDRPIEVDDVSMALVRFENGALGTITNSALSPRQETTMRLDFQRATVEVTALYRASNANWRFTIPEGSADGDALARWQMIEQDVTGSHDAQLADLLDSMDRGERPLVSGVESRRILEFIASLYKSSVTGQPSRRGSISPDDPFYHAMNGSLLPANKS